MPFQKTYSDYRISLLWSRNKQILSIGTFDVNCARRNSAVVEGQLRLDTVYRSLPHGHWPLLVPYINVCFLSSVDWHYKCNCMSSILSFIPVKNCFNWVFLTNIFLSLLHGSVNNFKNNQKWISQSTPTRPNNQDRTNPRQWRERRETNTKYQFYLTEKRIWQI